MDISINDQNQERIRRKVETGMYPSPDDVIARALELLDEQDEALERELADVHAKVQKGIEEANAGKLTPASEVFEELRKRNTAFKQRKQ